MINKFTMLLWEPQDNLFGAEKIVYTRLVRIIGFYNKDKELDESLYSYVSAKAIATYEHMDRETVGNAFKSLAEKKYIFLTKRFHQSPLIKLNHEIIKKNNDWEGMGKLRHDL